MNEIVPSLNAGHSPLTAGMIGVLSPGGSGMGALDPAVSGGALAPAVGCGIGTVVGGLVPGVGTVGVGTDVVGGCVGVVGVWPGSGAVLPVPAAGPVGVGAGTTPLDPTWSSGVLLAQPLAKAVAAAMPIHHLAIAETSRAPGGRTRRAQEPTWLAYQAHSSKASGMSAENGHLSQR